MLWHDNCMIPLHAQHPRRRARVDELLLPARRSQALIEDWVNYICPVPAAQQVIAGPIDDPAVANSPLVFPTGRRCSASCAATTTSRDIDDHEEWNDTFDPMIQS